METGSCAVAPTLAGNAQSPAAVWHTARYKRKRKRALDASKLLQLWRRCLPVFQVAYQYWMDARKLISTRGQPGHLHYGSAVERCCVFQYLPGMRSGGLHSFVIVHIRIAGPAIICADSKCNVPLESIK